MGYITAPNPRLYRELLVVGEETEVSETSTTYITHKSFKVVKTIRPYSNPIELTLLGELKTNNPLYKAWLAFYVDDILRLEFSTTSSEYEVFHGSIDVSDWVDKSVHPVDIKLKSEGGIAYNRLIEAYLRG